MMKTIAIIFGLILLAVGILGFMPQFTPNGNLFGIFHVNNIHNYIHIASGALALLCGLFCVDCCRLYFKVFGIIYAIVAILGFYYGDRAILNLIANNMADNLLHTVIAIFALYMGFGCCSGSCSTGSCSK